MSVAQMHFYLLIHSVALSFSGSRLNVSRSSTPVLYLFHSPSLSIFHCFTAAHFFHLQALFYRQHSHNAHIHFQRDQPSDNKMHTNIDCSTQIGVLHKLENASKRVEMSRRKFASDKHATFRPEQFSKQKKSVFAWCLMSITCVRLDKCVQIRSFQ